MDVADASAAMERAGGAARELRRAAKAVSRLESTLASALRADPSLAMPADRIGARGTTAGRLGWFSYGATAVVVVAICCYYGAKWIG